EQAETPMHDIEAAADRRLIAGAGDPELAPPLAVETAPAHERLARYVELGVERDAEGRLRRRGRLRLDRGGALSEAAVDLDDVELHHAPGEVVGNAKIALRHGEPRVELGGREAAGDPHLA